MFNIISERGQYNCNDLQSFYQIQIQDISLENFKFKKKFEYDFETQNLLCIATRRW